MSVSRIHRLLRLVTIMQSGRCLGVDELAVELDVSRRTVFRDLNMLELAHIPYYFDRQRNGYRINNHFFLPPINLTLDEALSVMLLSMRRRSSTAVPWFHQAARAAMKIESALPAPLRDHIGSVLENLQVRLAPAARHEGLDGVLDALADAIVRRRVCRMTYISFYERQQMRLTVHPLRLAFVQRAWYVLAWSGRHKEVRTFKLGRIKKLDVLSRAFTPPAEVDVDRHFGQAWNMIPEGKLYDVRLRFDRQVAGNVAEVQWHPSQTVAWGDDGSLDFRVRVDGLGEITWWVLGYGDKVRVIAPAALARNVRKTAERVVRHYQQEGP